MATLEEVAADISTQLPITSVDVRCALANIREVNPHYSIDQCRAAIETLVKAGLDPVFVTAFLRDSKQANKES